MKKIQEKVQKPIKAKPVFYSVCYEPLKVMAKEMGYNLLINGSLNRDMDLVAIPWTDFASSMIDVVIAFDKYLRGVNYEESAAERGYKYSKLPGGRHSYVIDLNRGGNWNQHTDEQWYIDISFTPNASGNNLTLQEDYDKLESDYKMCHSELMELQDSYDNLKQQADEMREAFRELIQVKEWNDKYGKDEHYNKAQSIAWAIAQQALTEYENL